MISAELEVKTRLGNISACFAYSALANVFLPIVQKSTRITAENTV